MEQNRPGLNALLIGILAYVLTITVILYVVVVNQVKTIEREVVTEMQLKDQKQNAPAMMCGYIAAKNPTVDPNVTAIAVPYVFSLCETYQVNAYLVFAVIERECNFNWLTRPGGHGEHGPMQIMPVVFNTYAPGLGYEPEAFESWKKTTEIGVIHLAKLLKKYKNDYGKALTEYNAGTQEHSEEIAAGYVKVVYAYHMNICIALTAMDKLTKEAKK
jgi:hypothetical protein